MASDVANNGTKCKDRIMDRKIQKPVKTEERASGDVCPRCRGSRVVDKKPCPVCRGTGKSRGGYSTK
jgi:DnaJ-class molecular chaperone